MAGTTDDTIDRQLEDSYGKLGLRRYTDNDHQLCLRANGSCDPNSTCLVLQNLITSSQETFRGRKNTKALIMKTPPLLHHAMVFVKDYGAFLSPTQNSDSMDMTICVFHILTLEGERSRQGWWLLLETLTRALTSTR